MSTAESSDGPREARLGQPHSFSKPNIPATALSTGALGAGEKYLQAPEVNRPLRDMGILSRLFREVELKVLSAHV